MDVETHFVQAGDGPILIGSAAGTLSCACGNLLVQGYEPARFLAVGIQCAKCGTVTATPPLADGILPPRSALIAAPSQEPRTTSMTVPASLTLVGQAEMARLQALFTPATPADSVYTLTAATLDEAVAAFERYTGEPFPEVETDRAEPFAGLRVHALGWAMAHLRGKMGGAWACMEDPPTASAVTHVAGFLHFVATWSRHPLFPAMVSTAADHGFSLHGLTLFAGAHCLTLMGNRVRMPEPLGDPGRIEDFALAINDSDTVGVQMDVFDRFEFPFGAKWDQASLRGAVADAIGAAQGHINLRNPGLLLLSPGTAMGGFDEALIEAVTAAVASVGRKNRGLMGVAPIVLRLQPLPDPHAVRFGYGFFPIANRHYRGETPLLIGR